MNNMFFLFRQFASNPRQFLAQRMGIPEDKLQNPNDAINWLMRNGRLTQQQYNQAAQMANQMNNKS